MVSSESDWDKLSFTIDDQVMGTWSGLVDWKVVTFPVSAGSHTLTWEYNKDFANSANLDAAWLDDLSLPLSIEASLKGISACGTGLSCWSGENLCIDMKFGAAGT